jgi:hypothetical protein
MHRYDTLIDVKQACGTAVDILNDLLCFDKLESGILELHKHKVSHKHIIYKYIYMYVRIYIDIYYILNELLCFDKLESGMLELHKHKVRV